MKKHYVKVRKLIVLPERVTPEINNSSQSAVNDKTDSELSYEVDNKTVCWLRITADGKELVHGTEGNT